MTIMLIFKIIKYLIYCLLALYPIVWLAIGVFLTFYANSLGIETEWGIYFTINPILLFIILKRLIKRWSKAFIVLSILLLVQMSVVNILLQLEGPTGQLGEDELFKIIDLGYFGIIVMLTLPKLTTKKISLNRSKTKLANDCIVFKTKQGKIYLENPMRGIYIQGGAGSGKSESLFKPIIKHAAEKSLTGILYDFKSTELSKYYYYFQKAGVNKVTPYFVDFLNPSKSHRINPLAPEYLIKSAYAFEYSETIINNLLPETIKERKFWDRDAQSILTGIIWYIKKHHPDQCSLPHIISLVLEADTQQLLDKVSSDSETAGMVVSLRQAMKRGADKQVAGVISTLQTALSRLNNPEIFWLLSGNDLSLDLNNPDAPKFLCIGNDSSLPQTYSPAISLIISVATKLMNKPHKLPSIIILDEAPTIYIPNFEQIPATGRSNKISTVFGAQDYSQVVEKYGNEKAQVILANLGNQFFGRTSNTKTAEIIQSIFSKEDKVYWASHHNRGSSGKIVHLTTNDGKGKSQSIQERERLKISQILRTNSGQFYGVIAEGSPREFIGYQFDYQNEKVDISKSMYSIPEVDFETIVENYHRIISEARDIIEPKRSTALLDI